MNIPSTTTNQNDLTRASLTHNRQTSPDCAERPVEVNFHLITNVTFTAHIIVSSAIRLVSL